VSLLALPRDSRAQLRRVVFVDGNPRDPLLPEPDVYSGVLTQGWGQVGVQLATGQPELEQRGFPFGTDLGGQHSGGCSPSLALIVPPFQEQDLSPGLSQLASASRPYRSTANDNSVKDLRHDGAEETF